MGGARRTATAIRLGRARQLFLSAEASSNVVGHTADLLLEIDEAQDVDIDKFDKELRPMAASSGATTVFYGTAWDDANLLERAKQAHLELRAPRRPCGATSSTTGGSSRRSNPAYGRFVRSERERLGAEHPLFLTQYCLRDAAGRRTAAQPDPALAASRRASALDGPVAGRDLRRGPGPGGRGVGAGARRGTTPPC